jgi:hypothetical protein
MIRVSQIVSGVHESNFPDGLCIFNREIDATNLVSFREESHDVSEEIGSLLSHFHERLNLQDSICVLDLVRHFTFK